jgi:hypothetical protein
MIALINAGQHIRIGCSLFQDPVQHLANGNAARSRDERTLGTVPLGAPLILNGNRPVDDVKLSIVLRMGVQVTRKGAIKRGDRDGVVETCAAIWGS